MKVIRSFYALAATGGLLAGTIGNAFADWAPPNGWADAAHTLPKVNLVVDGTNMGSGYNSYILVNRTEVPLRFVAENLGATVIWEPNSYTVLVTLPNPTDMTNPLPTLQIPQLQKPNNPNGTYDANGMTFPVVTVYVNGQKIQSDIPAIIDPSTGRTMVPVRFVSETLGFKVDWDASTYTVTITKSSSSGSSGPLPIPLPGGLSPSALPSGLPGSQPAGSSSGPLPSGTSPSPGLSGSGGLTSTPQS
jgi:hypothetical protein